MVVLQTIVLKKLTLISFLHFSKSQLLLKYFLNKKKSLFVCQISQTFRKSFYSTKQSYGLVLGGGGGG